MDNKDKDYLRTLLLLKADISSRIDNEITEGILRGRPDVESLVESIEYKTEEFLRVVKSSQK